MRKASVFPLSLSLFSLFGGIENKCCNVKYRLDRET